MSFGSDVGSFGQLVTQMMVVIVVAVYAFVVSWVLDKIIHSTMGMRLIEENEVQRMDYTEHAEAAYI